MKEYVEVPDALLRKTPELRKYFDQSYAYVGSLKPKPKPRKLPQRSVDCYAVSADVSSGLTPIEHTHPACGSQASCLPPVFCVVLCLLFTAVCLRPPDLCFL
jgi:hypothetical protein